MHFIIRHIEEIIDNYRGHPPLSIFLKNYFRQHPKLGSRDRKAISEAVYTYYRFASFSKETSILSVVLQGLGASKSENILLNRIFSEQHILVSDLEKTVVKFDHVRFSKGIEPVEWQQSMLVKPQLFIRILKHESKVLEILHNQQISFTQVPVTMLKDSCVALPNGSKVDQVLDARDYVIQDWASQSSLQLALAPFSSFVQGIETGIWDVCSGAGGKSLLLKALFPDQHILATDIRDSILHNYRERMKTAGCKDYDTITLNAASKHEVEKALGSRKFRLIICDVPCSGSGTWARTPEQFFFFDKAILADFPAIQYQIAVNAMQQLAPKGLFVYITCSVFYEENEAVLQQLQHSFADIEMVYQELINGITHRADSMFVAVFQKK